MAQKKFAVTLDTTEFLRGTQTLEEAFARLQKNVQTSMKFPSLSRPIMEAREEVDLLGGAFQRAAGLAAGIFAVNGIQGFVQKLYSIRGEFQQLEISFQTMLGSGAKARELIDQLAQTAASTPFDLQGIANSAKQMLAYGFAADQVNDTIVRLGNVASGLSQPLGDIVYLYGTLKASGRVTNIDIRQFANRGIPIYEELAKVMGKNVDEINKLVTAGKVGFPEVEQAFNNMTNKGGKFYNLMQEQSKSLTGQISNLQDNLDMMFNNIGKSQEGILNLGLKGVSFLIENYEKVGKVIAALIATYGVYRAAIITNIALTNAWAAASKADSIAKGIQAIATNAATLATKRLTAALLANPFGAIAVALTAVIGLMWAFSDSTTSAEKAQERFNEEKKRAEEADREHKATVEELLRVAQDEAKSTAERTEALEQLRKFYPNIFSQYDTESLKLADILNLKRQIAEEDGKKKVDTTKSELEKAKKEYEEASKKLADQKKYSSSGSLGDSWMLYKFEKEAEKAKAYLDLKKREYGNLHDNSLLDPDKLAKATDKELERYKAQIQSAIKKGKEVSEGRRIVLGDGADFFGERTSKEWEAMLARVTKQQELRGKTFKSFSEQMVQATKDEEKARKELQAFNALSSKQLAQKRDEEIQKGNYGWDADEYRKKLQNELKEKETIRKDVESRSGKKSSSSSSKTSTAVEKAREEEERRQQSLRYAREEAKAQRDSQLQLDTERVELMEGGFAKEMAQLQIQHRRKMAALDDQVQERLSKIQEQRKLEWEATHNSKKEVYRAPSLKESDLSDTDLNQILIGRELADQALAQGQEKILRDLRSKYLSYEEQKTEVKKKYEEERKVLDQSTLLSEEMKASVRVQMARKEAEELKAIDNDRYEHTQKTNELMVELFLQQGERTTAQMRNTIDKAKELLSYLSSTKASDLAPKFGLSSEELQSIQSSPEKLRAITDALKSLQDELGNVSPWQSFALNMETALAKGKQAWLDYKKTREEAKKAASGQDRARAEELASISLSKVGLSVSKVGSSIKDATPLVKELGSSLGAIFGDGDIANEVEALTDALTSLSGVVSGVGSIMSGDILGGVTSLIGVVGNLFSKAQKAENDMMEKRRKAVESLTKVQHEYTMELIRQNLAYERGSTIFGEDTYGKARNSIEVARKSLLELRKSMKFTKQELSGNNLLDWFGGGLSEGGFGGRQNREVNNKIAEMLRQRNQGEYDKLLNLEVKTGSRKTGILWWRKTVDEFGSLKNLYPNLIDANGKLNISLAESILKSQEFRKGHKEALERSVELAKQYEESIKTMNDYLKGVFGSLGSSITDSLVNAFRRGEDATKAFTSSVSELLNNFIKQMAYSSFIAPIFERAQKEVSAIMGKNDLNDSDRFSQIADALRKAMDSAKDIEPSFRKFIEERDKEAKSRGFDTAGTSSDSRSAVAKGIAQASQDSIDVLTGLWHTNVLLSERTANATERLVSIMDGRSSIVLPSSRDMGLDQFGVITEKMYKELQAIQRNTLAGAEAGEAIRFILSEMGSNGIKIRR